MIVEKKYVTGEGTCGLNVHNAGQHLADYAEGWGPLWAWSTFGFEDMKGTLMDFAHGTGNVCRQVFNLLFCTVGSAQHIHLCMIVVIYFLAFF